MRDRFTGSNDENDTFRSICESCGKETWWNMSTTFTVGMQEDQRMKTCIIQTCEECGAVESYSGTSNLSS